MKIPKRWPYYIAAGVLVFLSFKVGFLVWDIYDSASVARGEYISAMKYAKAQEKVRLSHIKDLEKQIYRQTVIIQGLGGEIIKAGKERKDLEAKTKIIEGQLSVAKTDAERVVLLTTQVSNLTLSLNKADSIIAAQDKQIDAWATKYNLEVKIAEDYRTMWENEKRRADAAKDMARELEKDLKISRLGGKVKTGLIIAAGVYIGYKLMGGGK